MVWILPEDDDFDLVEGTGIECAEHVPGFWKYGGTEVFAPDEFGKLVEIWLFEFLCEDAFPGGFDADVFEVRHDVLV